MIFSGSRSSKSLDESELKNEAIDVEPTARKYYGITLALQDNDKIASKDQDVEFGEKKHGCLKPEEYKISSERRRKYYLASSSLQVESEADIANFDNNDASYPRSVGSVKSNLSGFSIFSGSGSSQSLDGGSNNDKKDAESKARKHYRRS